MSSYFKIAFEPWTEFSAALVKQCCLAFVDIVKGLPEDQMAMVNFTFNRGCELRDTREIKKGDSVFILKSGEEVAVKDAFIVNMCGLNWALVSYKNKAQAYHSRSRIPIEMWIPDGFSATVERLDNFFEDVNNLSGAREVIRDEVVRILMGLP
jgi:hypothetical protein